MHHEPSRIQSQRRKVQVQKENEGHVRKPSNCKAGFAKKTVFEKGLKFGRLLVLSKIGQTKKDSIWQCQCDCGKIITCLKHNLIKGNTKSCGCLNRDSILLLNKRKATHGKSKAPVYKCWFNIKQRCLNPLNAHFKNYGGRGIKIHKEWENNFYEFYKYVGERPSKNHSIDRIDNNGNYEPGNVRWADRETQNNNRRVNVTIFFNGERFTVASLAKRFGLNPNPIYKKIKLGIQVEKIFS